MVTRAPVRFDPARLAGHPEALGVSFPLSHCKRLIQLLNLPEAAIGAEIGQTKTGQSDETGYTGSPEDTTSDLYRLTASLRVSDRQDYLLIEGQLQSVYPLVCQRCLETYDHPIEHQFALVPVRTQAEADELDDELDPVLLDDNGQIHLVDLFEDELILLLPTIPRHVRLLDCGFGAEADTSEIAHVLADGPATAHADGEVATDELDGATLVFSTSGDSGDDQPRNKGDDAQLHQRLNPFDVLKSVKFGDKD